MQKGLDLKRREFDSVATWEKYFAELEIKKERIVDHFLSFVLLHNLHSTLCGIVSASLRLSFSAGNLIIRSLNVLFIEIHLMFPISRTIPISVLYVWKLPTRILMFVLHRASIRESIMLSHHPLHLLIWLQAVSKKEGNLCLIFASFWQLLVLSSTLSMPISLFPSKYLRSIIVVLGNTGWSFDKNQTG